MKRYAIIFISALAGSASADLSTMDLNSDALYPRYRTCEEVTDCYGCTLNNCLWDQNRCTGIPWPTSVTFFTLNAQKCGDQLGVCQLKEVPKEDCGDKCEELNQKFDKIVLSFTPEAPNKEIPKGYFCYFNLAVNSEYDPIVYWNQTSSEEFLMYHGRYY